MCDWQPRGDSLRLFSRKFLRNRGATKVLQSAQRSFADFHRAVATETDHVYGSGVFR